jgi:hypothetical protein
MGSTNAVLAAVADGGSAAAFAQSVTEVQNYSQAMAGLSMTGDATADGVLNQAKTDAAQWYNTIYPTYLNMPTTITDQSASIDSGLTALVQLASQLQSDPSNADVRQAVNNEASSLSTTVSSLQSQTQALSSDLSTFASNLQSDVGALGSALNALNTQVNDLEQQLSQLYGQLHSLQSATCPNQGDINSCQNAINSVTNQAQQASNAAQTVSDAGQAAVSAGSGLQYLGGYWSSVTSDAGNCVNALTKMQSDPASIVQIDLANTQQLWNSLKTELSNFSTT